MTATPSLLSPRYRRVSVAIYTMVSLSAFENLGVLAATPEIAEDLGDVSLLPWVVTAYLMSNSIASVVSGKFIDGVGVRAIFRIGVTVFMVGALLAAAAPSMQVLVAARVVHGIGGGLVFASSLSAVPLVYPTALVGRAYAANATVWGVLGVAGPALAALILTVLSWEWIFLLIVPLGLVGLALAWNTLPGPVARDRVAIDVRGTVLVALFFVGLVLAVGWLTADSIVAGLVALVAAAAYVAHERSVREPVIRLRHLVGRPYGALNGGIALLLSGAFGVTAYTPLYVAAARGGSEAAAAWSVLFVTIGWTLGANWVARIDGFERLPVLSTAGGGVALVALIGAASLVLAGAALWTVFALLVMLGWGIGMTTNTVLQQIRLATPDEQLGRATTVHDFGRNTGFTTGVAISGAVLLLVLERRLADVDLVRSLLAGEDVAVGGAAPAAVGDAYAIAMLVGAGLVAASIPILWSTRGRGRT